MHSLNSEAKDIWQYQEYNHCSNRYQEQISCNLCYPLH
jgi:hypothetical protein